MEVGVVGIPGHLFTVGIIITAVVVAEVRLKVKTVDIVNTEIIIVIEMVREKITKGQKTKVPVNTSPIPQAVGLKRRPREALAL